MSTLAVNFQSKQSHGPVLFRPIYNLVYPHQLTEQKKKPLEKNGMQKCEISG